MTDYYEILEVSREATKEEIKSAFRKKARTLHPDVNKAPDAEEKASASGAILCYVNSVMLIILCFVPVQSCRRRRWGRCSRL